MPTENARDWQHALVYTLWCVILFDPQFFLRLIGLGFAVRVPLVLVLLLALTLLLNPRKSDLLLGIAGLIAVTVINLPFAYNRGNMIPPLRTMMMFYICGIGVLQTIRSPRTARPIFFMLFVGQYLWWGVMGIKSGMVPWHPNLDNFDGYGPLMVIGVGPAYFYALSVPKGWRKWLAFLASALCVIGVVSAFARGSVLTLIVTVAYIWFRSPRKALTAGLMVAAFAIVAVCASLIDGTTRGDDTRANFWDEMSTMFHHEEGSTGSDREKLWAAAIKVFQAHPVFGVGPENFGPAATTILRPGEIGGAAFTDNPNMLYARALHSNYYQLLSEFGFVGTAIFAWLCIQFLMRGTAARRAAIAERWRAAGGIEDPRMLSLGLECGAVAYIVSGVFYNQLFTSWFFSLIIANTLVYSLVLSQKAPTRVSLRRGAGIRRPSQ